MRRTLLAILAGGLSFGLMAGALLIVSNKSDPSYAGKRLSEWALELSYGTAQQNADARIAIKALGPRAVPALIRMAERDDSKLVLLLRKTLASVPYFWWFDMPASTSHALAATALRELGPLAKPAIPALQKLAQSTDTLVRSKATAALLVIRNQPTQSLGRILQDPSPANLSNWVVAVGVASELGENARPLIPLFVESLKHTNLWVRWHSTTALGTIALEPDVCVPTLVAGLRDPEALVRQQSLFVLQRFPGAVARAQTEIQQCFVDPTMRIMALFLLTEALPSLNSNSVAQAVQPLLNDPEQSISVRGMAQNLLNNLRKTK